MEEKEQKRTELEKEAIEVTSLVLTCLEASGFIYPKMIKQILINELYSHYEKKNHELTLNTLNNEYRHGLNQ